MSQLSIEKLRKVNRQVGNDNFIQHISKSICRNRRRLAKSIYNLQSRNIRQFTKEWMAFHRKLNETPGSKGISVTNVKRDKFGRTMRYQQDQELQFDFEEQFETKKPFQKQHNSNTPDKPKTGSEAKSSSQTTNKNIPKKIKIIISEPTANLPRLRLVQLREKSHTMIRESKQRKMNLRQRIATQWQEPAEKYVQSRLSLNPYEKSQESSNKYVKQQGLIDVTLERMGRFIENLHRLEWSYRYLQKNNQINEDSASYKEYIKQFKFDQDQPISEHSINFMVERRYQLRNHHLQDIYEKKRKELEQDEASRKNSKFINKQQYKLLDSLSNNSILQIIKKKQHHHLQNDHKHQYNLQSVLTDQSNLNSSRDVHFNLPYAEFISYRSTKTSLYRLCSMNNKLTNKIAFMIFDKNRNGLIDEYDLLQLISLSRIIPILERDINIIAKAMLSQQRKSSRRLTTNKSKARVKAQKYNSSEFMGFTERKNDSQEGDKTPLISPIKEEDFSISQNQNVQSGLSSSRFCIQKLYTFLKQKQVSPRQKNAHLYPEIVRPLSFKAFCESFVRTRPFVIYDFMEYILNAQPEDFTKSIQQELLQYKKCRNHTKYQTHNSAPKEETLQQKWNRRLKQSNQILTSLVRSKQTLLV